MPLSFSKVNNNIIELQETYKKAQPFPYIILDDFLDATDAEEVLREFPKIAEAGWIHYLHINEKKHGLNKLDAIPDAIKTIIGKFNSDEFVNFLEELTGIKNLIADKTIEGGGIHQSERGGFLNIHADFTVHPHKSSWRRRVNVLLYLNTVWDKSYKGDLEFWDKNMTHCVTKIAPVFNRVVIFNTDETSYHGFPDPIQCPEHVTRKSIALYYFTEEDEGSFKKKATNYKARPEDGLKAILIWADKKAISAYTAVKRITGINDDFVSKVLHMFKKKL